MKPVVAVAVALAALFLGFVVGGVGPRAELRQARKELETAKAEGCEAAPGLPLALGGLMAGAAVRPPPPPKFVAPPPGPTPVPEPAPKREPGGSPERMAEGFDKMKAAADLRAAQFRAAFLEQARLPPEKERALDEAIARMNAELAGQAAQAIEALKGRDLRRLAPRDFVDVAAKLMGAYQKADDEWKAGLDDPARAAMADTKFDLLTQIDVGALRPVLEQMERAQRERP